MFEQDLGGALLGAAERHAARPALWAAGQRLRYGELFDQAAAIAAALIAAGVAPGARVAILSRRSTLPYAALIGVLLAGCTYVPLNTRFTRERNQAMLTAADAAALVIDEASAAKLDSYLAPLDPSLIVLRPEVQSEAPGIGGKAAALVCGDGPVFWRSARRPVEPSALMYLLFTSGTTGVPKGVPISHANVAVYLEGVSVTGEIMADDRVLQMVDLTFDVSVHDMMLAWLNGAELYSVPENASMMVPRLIAQHGITTCLIVPVTGAVCLQKGLAKPGSMPTLRLTYFCGEALPRSVAEGWRAATSGGRVINLYGPTEATIAFSQYEHQPDEATEFPIVPIGLPFAGQRMGVFSPEMIEMPHGEHGQICLAGSQLAEGYCAIRKGQRNGSSPGTALFGTRPAISAVGRTHTAFCSPAEPTARSRCEAIWSSCRRWKAFCAGSPIARRWASSPGRSPPRAAPTGSWPFFAVNTPIRRKFARPAEPSAGTG